MSFKKRVEGTLPATETKDGASAAALTGRKRMPEPAKLRVDGAALCLSGGGFRATLFHVGVLYRLNEFGALRGLKRVSAVSGGSITAAYLALCWKHLAWDKSGSGKATNFYELVARPLMKLCKATIIDKDISTIIQLGAGKRVATIVAEKLRPLLSVPVTADESSRRPATLQDLPDPGDAPEFFFNATNVKTGNLFLFTKRYFGEHEVGAVLNPDLELALAVTASAGFPPVISPVRIPISSEWKWVPWAERPKDSGAPAGADGHRVQPQQKDFAFGCGLNDMKDTDRPLYEEKLKAMRTGTLYLGDGGIYDNLGLDVAITKFGVVIVSDAGMPMTMDETPQADVAMHGIRVSELVDNQVRVLRKKQLVEAFQTTDPQFARSGCYLSIRGSMKGNPELDRLQPRVLAAEFPDKKVQALASIETCLHELSDDDIFGLLQWGYARCDAVLRGYVLRHPEDRAVLGVRPENIKEPRAPMLSPPDPEEPVASAPPRSRL